MAQGRERENKLTQKKQKRQPSATEKVWKQTLNIVSMLTWGKFFSIFVHLFVVLYFFCKTTLDYSFKRGRETKMVPNEGLKRIVGLENEEKRALTVTRTCSSRCQVEGENFSSLHNLLSNNVKRSTQKVRQKVAKSTQPWHHCSVTLSNKNTQNEEREIESWFYSHIVLKRCTLSSTNASYIYQALHTYK